MRCKKRHLEFDNLEQMTLLSGVHAAAAHIAPSRHAHPVPKLVLAVTLKKLQTELVKLESAGISDVSITPVLAAPGSGAEYQIAYTQNGVQQTKDFWVPYRPPVRPGAPVPG